MGFESRSDCSKARSPSTIILSPSKMWEGEVSKLRLSYKYAVMAVQGQLSRSLKAIVRFRKHGPPNSSWGKKFSYSGLCRLNSGKAERELGGVDSIKITTFMVKDLLSDHNVLGI